MSGWANSKSGSTAVAVPASMISSITKAAANLASTICHSASGSDSSNSIVPDLFSSANTRIVSSGITSNSSRLML